MIVSDPNIMLGKPVVQDTRITVELILEKLAAKHSFEQILTAHPRLTQEGILEAIDYAAKMMKSEVVLPLTKKSA